MLDILANSKRRFGRLLRPDGDHGPLEIVPLGVVGKHSFVFNEHGSDDGRVVRPPDVIDMVGNEAQFVVGIDQCIGRFGDCDVRQIVVCALDKVLHDIRQKLELLDQVGELWCVDFGKLQLECREFFVDSAQDFRCDLFRAVMEEFCYF